MSKEVTEEVVATVELPKAANKEMEIKQEVGQVELRAKGIIISTDVEYQEAAELAKEIKSKAGFVTDFFKPMKDSAYQAHKAVCDREKQMLEPLQNAEKTLKKSMTAYIQDQERKRLELEAKMKREAEEEKERKLNEAIELEAQGKSEEAEAAMLDAQFTENAGKGTVVMATPKVSGVSNSKDWEIESIDHGKVPVNISGVEIRPVDEKAVMRLIRASKGKIQIPGIAYKEILKVSIRR